MVNIKTIYAEWPDIKSIRDEFDCVRLTYTPTVYDWDIIYNNVMISSSDEFRLISYNNEDQEDAEILTDLLAYLFHHPTFIATNDEKLNSKLYRIYSNYLNLDEIGIENNLISNNYCVKFGKIENPVLLALYNTALKQPEPLAKCLFLFRIIENYHQKSNNNVPLKTFIEELYQSAIEFRYIPLDIAYSHERIKRTNMITEWKRRSKLTHKRWNEMGFQIGEQIYEKARCGIAHGRKKDEIILHDYHHDYKFVQEANVFLELLTRYIIEKENPQFQGHIRFRNRRKTFNYSLNPNIVNFE